MTRPTPEHSHAPSRYITTNIHRRETTMYIKRHHQGSIIVEVLIAASIFAVALLALVEFQATLLENRAVLSQQAEALGAAQNKLESFRSYTSLASTAGQFAYADITNGSSTNVGLTATFTTNW